MMTTTIMSHKSQTDSYRLTTLEQYGKKKLQRRSEWFDMFVSKHLTNPIFCRSTCVSVLFQSKWMTFLMDKNEQKHTKYKNTEKKTHQTAIEVHFYLHKNIKYVWRSNSKFSIFFFIIIISPLEFFFVLCLYHSGIVVVDEFVVISLLIRLSHICSRSSCTNVHFFIYTKVFFFPISFFCSHFISVNFA